MYPDHGFSSSTGVRGDSLLGSTHNPKTFDALQRSQMVNPQKWYPLGPNPTPRWRHPPPHPGGVIDTGGLCKDCGKIAEKLRRLHKNCAKIAEIAVSGINTLLKGTKNYIGHFAFCIAVNFELLLSPFFFQ